MRCHSNLSFIEFLVHSCCILIALLCKIYSPTVQIHFHSISYPEYLPACLNRPRKNEHLVLMHPTFLTSVTDVSANPKKQLLELQQFLLKKRQKSISQITTDSRCWLILTSIHKHPRRMLQFISLPILMLMAEA